MDTSFKIEKYRKALQEKTAHRTFITGQRQGYIDKVRALEEAKASEEEAAELVKAAVELTQSQFKVQMSDIVSYALAGVWADPYKFNADFVPRRNTMECDLRFVRKGHKVRPLKAGGYGAADIASLALRFAFRNLSDTRPIIFLDEPARQLSKDKHELAATMVKELVSELGLQLVMVTHRGKLLKASDKNFHIIIENGESKIQGEEQ